MSEWTVDCPQQASLAEGNPQSTEPSRQTVETPMGFQQSEAQNPKMCMLAGLRLRWPASMHILGLCHLWCQWPEAPKGALGLRPAAPLGGFWSLTSKPRRALEQESVRLLRVHTCMCIMRKRICTCMCVHVLGAHSLVQVPSCTWAWEGDGLSDSGLRMCACTCMHEANNPADASFCRQKEASAGLLTPCNSGLKPLKTGN